MKEILKQIWNGFSFPFSESSRQEFYQNLAESKSDLIAPEIDEETRKKNEMSQKIFETVKKDLEKYPPTEWKEITHNRLYCSASVYEHPCISYQLVSYYRDSISSRIPSGWRLRLADTKISITDDFEEKLYKCFMQPIVNRNNQLAEDEKNKALAEFLDDSKRIVCKENE